MRRWAAGARCLLAVAVLALGACSDRSSGLDGDLTDDWKPMAAATPFRPQAGVCHADLVQSTTADTYSPVPCAQPHLAETVAVATAGKRGAAQAFATCSTAASAFLGGDWRTGWVVLQPVLPSKAAWAGGARWVRCDVAETSPVDGALVHRTGSLKGSVKAGGRLRMGCANPAVRGDTVTEMHPVACPASHTAEFAGLFTTTRARSADLSSDEVARGCDRAIAKFAGIADDSSLPSRVGWLGFPPDDTAWQMGDRSIRCFLWLNGEKMTGSYRGAGPGKLKIHYVSR
jgi:putative regulator of septum formation